MLLSEHEPNNGECGDCHKHRSHVGSAAKSRKQGLLIGVLFGADKEGSEHGADDSHGGDEQRNDNRSCHHLGSDASEGGGCESAAGNYRAEIGLVEVGAHAGHVAHVVAHVVGDNGGVAGVVLGNSGLNLTHKVGTHVGGLGENSAAHTGKESHKGSSHSEHYHGVGDVVNSELKYKFEKNEPNRNVKKAESHNGEAHDRTGRKGHLESLVKRALTCVCCSCV